MKHLTVAVVILMLGLTAVFAQNTGKTKGWPTAQLKKVWGLNLKQPAGVQSSYTDDFILTVYMTGANSKTLQELKQQIEKMMGKQMSSEQKDYYDIGFKGGQLGGHHELRLKLKGNLLEMQIENVDN